LAVSRVDSSGMRRAMNAHREADRAIAWNSRVETVGPTDQVLNGMKRRLSQAIA
jgi:hypothetical protein